MFLKKKKMIIAIICATALLGMFKGNDIAYASEQDIFTQANESVMVSYKTHVQTIGWTNLVNNGETSGTVGSGLRMEGIKIQISNINKYSGSIQYKSHVQTYGWENNWSSDGETSGTQSQGKRLEAIKIRLSGQLAEKYDVYYRTHVQTYGWLGWASNGSVSGTSGYSKRVEAIQIVLVDKGQKAPGDVIESSLSQENGVSYETHMQTYGWINQVMNGQTGGIVGLSKRMEGIQIRLKDIHATGSIEYQTHIQTYGWESSWKKDGEISGTFGESKRLEAIRIRLTGTLKDKCDVYYRVHSQHYGWLDWVKNGEDAGTAGFSYRLEGIQIMLLPKNARTFPEGVGFISKSSQQPSSGSWDISNIASNTANNACIVNSVVEFRMNAFNQGTQQIECDYTWVNNSTGETGTIGSVSAGNPINWTPTLSGKYTVTMIARDSLGNEKKKTIAITVTHGTISKSDAFFTAHKGLSSVAPGNSIPAFELAGQYEFDSIETDVNETKDGVFVIAHDANLSEICGVDVNIADITWNELKDYTKYHIISGNGVYSYTMEQRRIPTLEDYLDICEQYDCIPQIDTKNLNSFESISRLYKILEDRNIQDRTIVTSFNNLYLQLLRELNSNMKLTYGVGSTSYTDVNWLMDYSIGVSADYHQIMEGNATTYTDNGIEVNAYTVDDKKDAGILLEKGVNSITTNSVLWE